MSVPEEKQSTRRQKMFAALPTMLTLANAACGFGSITFAAKVGSEYQHYTQGHDLLIAGLLIFLAMLFDMFDGTAARWTKQTSEFGAQLDSLCDAISFGVAPAFLMVQFCHDKFAFDDRFGFSLAYHPRLLWVIGLLFALCAVLRLARFNVETDEDDSHEFFSGLPSPAAAGVVASFPIGRRGLYNVVDSEQVVDTLAESAAAWLIPAMKIALPLITLAVAFLMVSRFRYSHVANRWLRGQKTRLQLIQAVFAVAFIFMVRELALPLMLCFFAFAAPLRAMWREVIARRSHKSQP